MNPNLFTPRLRVGWKILAAFMVFMTVTRIIFFAVFAGSAPEMQFQQVLQSFYLGLKFDLRTTLVLLLPFLLLSPLPWMNPVGRPKVASAWALFYTFIWLDVLFFYAFDFGYFAYLNGRLNASVLTFAYNMEESMLMLWQTYPIIWICAGFGVCLYVVFRLNQRLIFVAKPTPPNSLTQRLAAGVIIFVLVIAGLYGKISYYPLRWSEAFFSNNSFVSALALNPIHYFIDTLKNKGKEFDRKKTAKYYSLMSDYLGATSPNKENLNFQRPIDQTPMFKSKPNVVVVVMESLAAYKTGILGSPLQPTPYLDRLAEKGLLFKNYYVPTEGTARSMFGLLTGIPDLGPNRTSSRNPLIVSQNTVANAFTGYDRYYMIGGSANWGNIRGVYNSNIIDLQVIEEGMYDAERTDVWGLSDLQLFEEAHKRLSARESKKPFFAVIQAASFHRPYSIPKERGLFKEETVSDKQLKAFGFNSLAEYNSIRFSDYSMGRFFELMDANPRFDNTIYVVVGDHGLPDNNAEHLAPGINYFDLSKFHTPMVFYSKKLEPQVIGKVATQADVLPTLAGMTGHSMPNTTLGRNLFAEKHDQKRLAFVYFYYQKPPTIGVLSDEFYVVGRPGKIQSLHLYKGASAQEDVKDRFPDEFKYLAEMANGFYETSRYMLYHNPNLMTRKVSTQGRNH